MEKIKIIVILLALIIVAVFGWLKGYEMEKLAYTMAATLVIFYFLGALVQKRIKRIHDEQERLNREKEAQIMESSANIDVNQEQTHPIKK